MVIRGLFVLAGLVLAGLSVTAQAIVSGQITDREQRTLPGISVTVHPARGEAIIAFGITDANGGFAITIRSAEDSIRIRAYGLGWAEQERRLANRSQVANLQLISKPIALREVRVKPPPVARQRDTISYSVDALKNQSDRVIADVIKKLPGIEVEADGRILYQGKPINKYYIQGLDLLENKYRLANDNLPADAVAEVQVLENHQPIRMLDSLVFSDRAALNIKLKRAITTTGTAYAGGGALPVLWDANLTPMLFTGKNQFIASGQANNSGANVARQLKNISPGTVFNPLQNDDEKKDWVAIQPLATPDFDESRWLNNNIQLGTINYLKKSKNDLDLRLNVSYIYDYQQQRGHTKTIYYTPTDTVNLLENVYNQLYFQSLEARLTFQKNSPKKYVKNELVAKGNWDNQQGSILLNEAPVDQTLRNPFFWLTNRFTDIVKIRKTLLTIQSNTTFNRIPQSLAVTPGQFADLFNQGIAYQKTVQHILATSFITNNSVSLTKRVNRFILLPELGIEIVKQTLKSSIDHQTKYESNRLAGNFINQLDWFKLNGFLKLKTQYQTGAWRFELNSPLNYYQFIIQDSLANQGQHLSRLILEPRLTANHEISTFWSANSSVGYRNNFGGIDDVYYDYLLKTYRTLQRRDIPLQNNQTVSGTFGINYRNPLTSLFGSFFYSYALSINNLLYRFSLTPTGALDYSAIDQRNRAHIHLMTGQVSQYIPSLKTSISSEINWSASTSQQLLNNTLLTLTNQTISPGFRVATTINRVADIAYAYQLSLFTAQLSASTTQHTAQQQHTLKLTVYIRRNSYLSIKNEYYHNEVTSGRVRNFFTNLTFRHSIPKRKVDLETVCTNVWNTAALTTASLTAFSYIESRYELRPVQLVQKVRFSF
jgi:hypothetical protein